MTLQSSGAISLADVQTEFGGSNPIGIDEYYGRAAGIPASGTISLNDFYGKSSNAFTFTSNVFGYNDTYSQSANSSTYDGNTVTPGSGNSPKTFYVTTSPGPNGGQSTLTYYQGGSLNTTWSSVTAAYHTFTFGSSSMQFRSTNVDASSFDNTASYSSVYWTTDYGAPSSMFLYYHRYNLGGGGYDD